MKKVLILVTLTVLLILADIAFGTELRLHATFKTMVLFFSIQTFALWRMESLVPQEWQVYVSLVKITVRFLSSLVLIAVLLYSHDERVLLTIQFIGLYLTYMIFEIVFALTNLRRN